MHRKRTFEMAITFFRGMPGINKYGGQCQMIIAFHKILRMVTRISVGISLEFVILEYNGIKVTWHYFINTNTTILRKSLRLIICEQTRSLCGRILCGRYFQVHFLWLPYFYSNCTEKYSQSPINNKSQMAKIMTWRPLSELMMAQFIGAIMGQSVLMIYRMMQIMVMSWYRHTVGAICPLWGASTVAISLYTLVTKWANSRWFVSPPRSSISVIQ